MLQLKRFAHRQFALHKFASLRLLSFGETVMVIGNHYGIYSVPFMLPSFVKYSLETGPSDRAVLNGVIYRLSIPVK